MNAQTITCPVMIGNSGDEVAHSPRKAIVRTPGKRYRHCISCHPMRDAIDLDLAKEQHNAYCRTLAELGLEVIELSPDDSRPDSCFVEDNAVVHRGRALICRMAKESRRGEEQSVEQVLRQYTQVRRTNAPATVEGGDVIHVPDRLISGLSQRTNLNGIEQMRDWLGVDVDAVSDPSMIHLKSHATYLGENKMIMSRRFSSHPAFRDFDKVILPEDEAYAADTLSVGGTVLMASGRRKAHDLVRQAGFEVVPLDTSEFEKCEGALTCLSILI